MDGKTLPISVFKLKYIPSPLAATSVATKIGAFPDLKSK